MCNVDGCVPEFYNGEAIGETKSSQVETSLKKLIGEHEKYTDTTKFVTDVLGASLIDSSGNMKSLRQIMNDLRSGYKQLETPQKKLVKQILSLNMQLDTGKVSQDEYNKVMEELTERVRNGFGDMYLKFLIKERM